MAGELGVERADELTLIARELAWSPRTPEDEEVEEFAEQALGAQEESVMRIPTFHRGVAVPLADLPRLHGAAQRTSLVRLLLVAALATTLAWLFVVAESAGAGRAAVFPEGASTGVVALDMSASISGPIYARVATTLRGIVNANQSVGLIMYSDTAYELLPPNSPPGAMLQFIPFFAPLRYYGSTPVFGQTPWDTFMGGTRVGEGLKMARVALKRAHVKHGAILLVSDLDDSNADQATARAGGASASHRPHPGPHRAALRRAARPAPLRRALRRQGVRRPERLHAHREAARSGRRRTAALDAARSSACCSSGCSPATSGSTAGSPHGT